MLGKQVRDKITGFEGICTGRAEYLYGCTQFSIVPKAKMEEGKLGETYWFDEGRVEVTGEGIKAEQVTAEKPGGPNRDAPGQSA
jgi:hypothetical protein